MSLSSEGDGVLAADSATGDRPLVIGITTKHGDAEWVQR